MPVATLTRFEFFRPRFRITPVSGGFQFPLCWRLLSIAIAVVLTSGGTAKADPLPPVIKATLVDGRIISGRVSAQTSAERLSLLVASDRIAMTTTIHWSRLASAVTSDGQLTATEFKRVWPQYALTGSPLLTGSGVAGSPGHVPVESEPGEDDWNQFALENSHDASGSSNQRPFINQSIASVGIYAHMASYDGDPAADGLILELSVFNQSGQAIPVAGQIEARLIGLYQQNSGGRSTLDRPRRSVTEIERWGMSIVETEFVDGRVIVRLPFRQSRPETNLDLAPQTLLDVRFKVPSVGVFQATQADVLIREPGRFRDDLLQLTGRRQLPLERPQFEPRRRFNDTFRQTAPIRP